MGPAIIHHMGLCEIGAYNYNYNYHQLYTNEIMWKIITIIINHYKSIIWFSMIFPKISQKFPSSKFPMVMILHFPTNSPKIPPKLRLCAVFSDKLRSGGVAKMSPAASTSQGRSSSPAGRRAWPMRMRWVALAPGKLWGNPVAQKSKKAIPRFQGDLRISGFRWFKVWFLRF